MGTQASKIPGNMGSDIKAQRRDRKTFFKNVFRDGKRHRKALTVLHL